MDITELAKIAASGGLTVVLLYAAITFWQAFLKQVSERIDFLESRVKELESISSGKAKTSE